MATKKKLAGGRRKGAGRKPVKDKKVTISIYPQNSRIEKLGADTARELALNAIEVAYLKVI